VTLASDATAYIRSGCLIDENAKINNYGTIYMVGATAFGMRDNAQLINDGQGGEGIFEIQTGSDITTGVSAGGAPNALLKIQSGGVLDVDVSEGGGGNSIFPALSNVGGSVELNGAALTLKQAYMPVSGDTSLGLYGQLTVEGVFGQSGGKTTVDGGSITATSFQLADGTLQGNGQVNANVSNGGRILVTSLPLQLSGDYTQTSAGVLQITLCANSPPVPFMVSGNVTLDGTLNIQVDSASPPPASDSFVVVSYGGPLSGQFAQFQGMDPSWVVNYSTDYIINIQS
jgi:hypothetical protein